MKKRFLSLAATLALTTAALSADVSNIKIGVVDFKQCVEGSKLGKQEQSNFEALKTQMESVLAEKDKSLNDMANKLNDADYLDSISPEAETELKRKFRALGQEMQQLQSQYYQTLNQANYKVVQLVSEAVAEASKEVAKKQNYHLIVNDESAFFSSEDLDISRAVIVEMDALYETQLKEDAKAQGKQGILPTPSAK